VCVCVCVWRCTSHPRRIIPIVYTILFWDSLRWNMTNSIIGARHNCSSTCRVWLLTFWKTIGKVYHFDIPKFAFTKTTSIFVVVWLFNILSILNTLHNVETVSDSLPRIKSKFYFFQLNLLNSWSHQWWINFTTCYVNHMFYHFYLKEI